MLPKRKVSHLLSAILLVSSTLILSKYMTPEHSHLTVICGAMCSGKTEELILSASRFRNANPDLIGIYKPVLDNRILANNEKDPSKFIASRNGSSIACNAVTNVAEMEKDIFDKNYLVIAIDEAQFFEKQEFMTFLRKMMAHKKRVIISGLDLDFRAETFGHMGEVLALADEVIKKTAICTQCGKDTFCITQRIIGGKPAHYDDDIIDVGNNQYKARCRDCHQVRKD